MFFALIFYPSPSACSTPAWEQHQHTQRAAREYWLRLLTFSCFLFTLAGHNMCRLSDESKREDTDFLQWCHQRVVMWEICGLQCIILLFRLYTVKIIHVVPWWWSAVDVLIDKRLRYFFYMYCYFSTFSNCNCNIVAFHLFLVPTICYFPPSTVKL